MNPLDYFGRPAFLTLLILLPIIWVLSFDSLAGLGRWRRLFALGLRSLVLVLLVFVLAQAQWPKTADRITVIYLLDQSSSIPQAQREYMLDYVYHAVSNHRRDNRKDMAGVIVFGGNAKIEAAPFDGEIPLIGRIESGFDLQTDATSLEAAFKLAKASFPEDSARRVVVVSDGNENLGDGLSLAQALAEDGIGIDVVPVKLFSTSEIAVEKVLLPSDIRKGQEFEARVVVSRDAAPDAGPVTGKLRITQSSTEREELIAEQTITLDPGKNVFPFVHKLDRTDAFTIESTFVPDDSSQDVVAENNKASAFTYVRGKGRVLLIEDGNELGEFAPLAERLRANAIEVDLMSSTQLYSSASELLQYDSIILANVPRATGEDKDSTESFSDTQIRMLVRNCEEMGCGIVMLGGDRSFGAGGWSNSELEKAMPVDFQIKNDKIDAVGALALMMHACEMADGNHWQTEVARQAIGVLGPMDYCGVVEWSNQGAPSWLWKMPTGMDRVEDKNRKTMLGLVGRMQMGDMPDFNAPMRLALNGLKNSKASVKHMIIISDGDPTPPTNQLIQDFIKNKIKISTVLIGNHSMTTPMQKIAIDTGGRYYAKSDPRALPKIFQREARRVAKPVIRESLNGMGIIADSRADSHEILQGIDTNQLPVLFGYVMTTIKKNPLVEQLAITNDPKDNSENTTLIATWRYGLGRTSVFTSDAGRVWTSEWLGSDLYDKLFTQLVRHSMRPITENANFTVSNEVKDGKARIVVNALDESEEFLNFLNMSARGINPDLKGFDIDFSQIGPGRYAAEVDVDQSGNYLFSIFPGEGYERLTTGVNVPYSAEYSDRESNLAFLDSLIQFDVKGGESGSMIEGELSERGKDDLLAVNTFRPTLSNTIGIHDIWPLLVVLCGTVFFADVFVRRVAIRFDWIGEWFRRLRSGRQEADVSSKISRLQSRKAEIEKQIEMRRSTTRFSPVEDRKLSGEAKLEQVIADEIDESADRRRPPPRDRSLETTGEEQSYTARLLDAKRKARRDQKRGDDQDKKTGD